MAACWTRSRFVPAAWKGPFQVNPPGQLQTRELPGEERRLVYRPQNALADECQFTITGPLMSDRGHRTSVPDIALPHVDRQQRWFILPSQAKGQSFRWQTHGLRPAPWPKHLAAAAASIAVAYEASREPVEAVLESAVALGLPPSSAWPT